MFESCAPLEPIFFTSAREIFWASPGVTTGSGSIWIGRSLGSRSALTAWRLEVLWTFFASFVSAIDGQTVNGWERWFARTIPQTQAASKAANRRPARIFHCRKSIGPRLRLSAGVLRRMDKLLSRRALARLKSDQIPDRGPGTEGEGCVPFSLAGPLFYMPPKA